MALPLLPALAAAVVAGWLWRENRGLRAELDRARGAAQQAPAAATEERDVPAAKAAQARRGGGVASFLRGLGRASDRERPELKAAQPDESRADRRRRRQEELRAMLGRDPDESVEEYRARVAPMIQTALAVPRTRLEEARRGGERGARRRARPA